MNKKNSLSILPLLLFVIICCTYFINSVFTTTEIDLEILAESNSICFYVDDVEAVEGGIIVEAIGYDKNNVIHYTNWVTGEGVNLYHKVFLVAYNDQEGYRIKTVSLYDSFVQYRTVDDIDFSVFKIKAIVPNSFLGYKLGLVSVDPNGNQSKLLTDVVLNND